MLATADAMDDRPLQVVLAGRYGVGKSFIFEKLPEEAERYGSELFTVDTGTGLSLLSGRDKWMVHVRCSGGKDTTVRLAGWSGKDGGKLHEVCACSALPARCCYGTREGWSKRESATYHEATSTRHMQ